MEPPPRSLSLDAHYCIMVRVPWPTEYKYASAIGCACWRAPLGIDSLPATTCYGRRNAEPMASAFSSSRRGDGRPSNKQRDKTTRTSALTEITPYKRLRAKPDLEGLDRLERLLGERMTPVGILEALADTEHWLGWTRHFGPVSGFEAKLDRPRERYLATTFCYGCGLGPTQAAR